jgi:hypothetical protein
MNIYLYDPNELGHLPRRDWNALLGEFLECRWDGHSQGFVSCNGTAINGVIIAHYSKLQLNDVTQTQLELFASNNCEITVVVVSGGGQRWHSTCPNVYFRKGLLSESRDDSFRVSFRRFYEHLNKTTQRAFHLLDTETPVLTSLAILLQLYAGTRIAVGTSNDSNILAESFGWNALSQEVKSRLTVELGSKWSEVSRGDWWMKSLGVRFGEAKRPDELQLRQLLASLIREINASPTSECVGADSLELKKALRDDAASPGREIVSLIEGEVLSDQLLIKTWAEIKAMLPK